MHFFTKILLLIHPSSVKCDFWYREINHLPYPESNVDHKSVSAACWLDIANQNCGQKEVSNNNIQAARRWAPQSHIACNDCGIDIYWDTWGCNKMLGNISTTSWGFIAYCVQTLFLSISRQHTKISADITLHIDCRRTITHHTERREQRSNTR